jgi:hypothetical protein
MIMVLARAAEPEPERVPVTRLELVASRVARIDHVIEEDAKPTAASGQCG